MRLVGDRILPTLGGHAQQLDCGDVCVRGSG